VISRQKAVGWILIVVSAAFIAYFVRERLFSAGPILEKKDWVQFIGSIVIFMLGTMNVRLAARRARQARAQTHAARGAVPGKR
jgi:CDP-diglyceride synthetase